MKKCFVVVAMLLMSQINANASIPIDPSSHIHPTGIGYGQANDTFFGPGFTKIGLGGAPANQFIVRQAFQFTVDAPFMLSSISIGAYLTPYMDVYDLAREEYIYRRLAEGATPEEIGIEINGDGVNPPTFVGPAQSITAYFALVEGSVPYRLYEPDYYPFPGDKNLGGGSHTFMTENSLDSVSRWVSIPLSVRLDPKKDYWIFASDPEFSGVILNYSTDFVGSVVPVPEPPTYFLFLAGRILLKTVQFES